MGLRPPRRPHGARADLANAAPILYAAAPRPPLPDLPLRILEPARLGVAELAAPPAAAPVPAGTAPAPRDCEEDPSGKRRRRDRRRATSSPPAPAPGVMDLPPPRGFVLRRSARKAARGWYAPLAAPALTSTRQAAILNPALVAAPTDAHGILIGRDRLSNTPVAHDPFTAYDRGTLTSPAVVVLGLVGAGKSTLIKTVYVLLPLIVSR